MYTLLCRYMYIYSCICMYIFVCMLALNQWSVRLLEIRANGCLAAAAIVLCSVWMPACISTPHLRCIQCVYVCVWASVRLTVWLTDCLLSSYPLLAAIFVVFLVNIEQIIFDTITHSYMYVYVWRCVCSHMSSLYACECALFIKFGWLSFFFLWNIRVFLLTEYGIIMICG